MNISNTKGLKGVIFYNAMKSIDADEWMAKVVKEKERFCKYDNCESEESTKQYKSSINHLGNETKSEWRVALSI